MRTAWATRVTGAPASALFGRAAFGNRVRKTPGCPSAIRTMRRCVVSSASDDQQGQESESADLQQHQTTGATGAAFSSAGNTEMAAPTLSASTAMFGRTGDLDDDEETCIVDECVEYYREPPHAISKLVDANVEPAIQLQPVSKEYVLVVTRPNLPQISELAYPELRLAGYRFHEDTFTPSRAQYASSIHLQRLDDPKQTPLPIQGLEDVHRGKRGEQPEIGYSMWSPNGKSIAFCIFTPGYGLELFAMDAESRKAKPLLPGRKLHAVCGAPYIWNSDSKSLIVKLVEQTNRNYPRSSPVPKGPLVQEFLGGKAAPSRTFQDLLSNPHERNLFEYFTQCELVRLELPDKDGDEPDVTTLAPPSAVRRASPSPDGKYLLLDTMQKPFEYLTPASRFPRKVEIISTVDGSLVTPVADIPLQDKIPIAFDAVGEGPRNISWRSDSPATLYWVEAQDGGDPAVKSSIRDTVFTISAPFRATPRRLASMAWRFTGIDWGNSDVALIGERQYKTRSIRRYLICPGSDEVEEDNKDFEDSPQGPCCERACDLRSSEVPKRLVFDRPNWEDRYTDPGVVLMRSNKFGKPVLRLVYRPGRSRKAPMFLLMSAGASEQGNRPNMSLFDPVTEATDLIWQSTPPNFETVVSLLQVDKVTAMPTKVLVRQESPVDYPNFFIYDFEKSVGDILSHTGEQMTKEDAALRSRTKPECFIQPITRYVNPAPELRDVKRELVSYERKDGVRLNAVLYLPPGFKTGSDKPLPLLLWAYPREFKNAKFAGQVQDSPYRFVRIARSPLIFLTLGYAILDGPQMPIIGEGDEEPNNTYVEQLVSSAEAAVDYVVGRGIADPKRVAIGGHSYGAFMTANLLIHAPKLFACGIARSGAYNRTLTPFGFQSEERTLWQAGDIYVAMSPYMFADKIESPLLLVHGEKDNNPGTFPMQSERLFQALKGHGKISRLVLLPFEEHGYRARESVLHTMYEMASWLEQYCPPNTDARDEGKV